MGGLLALSRAFGDSYLKVRGGGQGGGVGAVMLAWARDGRVCAKGREGVGAQQVCESG